MWDGIRLVLLRANGRLTCEDGQDEFSDDRGDVAANDFVLGRHHGELQHWQQAEDGQGAHPQDGHHARGVDGACTQNTTRLLTSTRNNHATHYRVYPEFIFHFNIIELKSNIHL